MSSECEGPKLAPEIEIDDYSKKTGKRKRERFVSDYTALINFMTRARLHEDTRREILYQAIQMYSGRNGYFDHTDYTYISDEARGLCDGRGRPHARSTIIKEHVVPISVSIEWLWRGADMTTDRVRRILEIASTLRRGHTCEMRFVPTSLYCRRSARRRSRKASPFSSST